MSPTEELTVDCGKIQGPEEQASVQFDTFMIDLVQRHEHIKQIYSTHVLFVLLHHGRVFHIHIFFFLRLHLLVVDSGSVATWVEESRTAELSIHNSTANPKFESSVISAALRPSLFSSISNLDMHYLKRLDLTVPTDQIPQERS